MKIKKIKKILKSINKEYEYASLYLSKSLSQVEINKELYIHKHYMNSKEDYWLHISRNDSYYEYNKDIVFIKYKNQMYKIYYSEDKI